MRTLETLVVRDASHRALLRRFHDELYRPAFEPAHREPLSVWYARLFGPEPSPDELVITLVGRDLEDVRRARLFGGVVAELYPKSRAAIVTYLVVAPFARRRGLGRALFRAALASVEAHAARSFGAPSAVFAEVVGPRAADAEAWSRLERFQRWGARVVAYPYLQPRLSPGRARDASLRLIVLSAGDARSLDGSVLAAFLREFHEVTEGAALDPEREALVAGIPARVPLERWSRGHDPRRIEVVATDYDHTIATEGRLDAVARDALVRLRAAGSTLVLVTGRHRADLGTVLAEDDLFDLLVLENGAVLVEPATGLEHLLAPPPDARFARWLVEHGVSHGAGRVVIGADEREESRLAEGIAELGLPLHVVRNGRSRMVLPRGVDKGTGLRAALARLGISAARCVAIGDAENDVALLEAAGVGVAVANAAPELRAVADWVLPGARGEGFAELANALLADPTLAALR